ncbi:hypothetical protein [Bacillus cihuensis]|uniref:hypothetical protein n=1 Tax=Bacillus cihuensis TaxID=1208599 RepID=UPI0003F83CD1|nr:hypothetical protein [Bacillus cihuensis]
MLHYTTNDYSYSRIKNLRDEEGTMFFFVDLTIIQYQRLGDSVRKKVNPIFAHSKVFPIGELPRKYNSLPDDVVYYSITKEEFTKLLSLSTEDPDKLFFFHK